MWGGSHFPKAKETGKSCHQPSGSSIEAFTHFPYPVAPKTGFCWLFLGSYHPYSHVGPNANVSPWCTGPTPSLVPGQGTGERAGEEAWAFPSLLPTSQKEGD